MSFKWAVLFVVGFLMVGCGEFGEVVSDTGIKKATAIVRTQSDGLTVEQQNIKARVEGENLPGQIKHLCVQSSYTGKIVFYSSVRGKVTSSGKRLTPYTVESAGTASDGFPLSIGSWRGTTLEVLQDDGTYGHSVDYLYWWDTVGKYHQLYPTGGIVIHISDQPLPLVDDVLALEVSNL